MEGSKKERPQVEDANTYHNLATPVEQPSLAGLTQTVSEPSFDVKSCHVSSGGIFSSSSFLLTSLLIVRTP